MTGNENAANILLQRLVREVTKLWNGEPSEIKNAWDAYELCYAIGEMTIGNNTLKELRSNTRKE